MEFQTKNITITNWGKMWEEAKRLPIPELQARNFGELVSLCAFRIITPDDIAAVVEQMDRPKSDSPEAQQLTLLENLYLIFAFADGQMSGHVFMQYVYAQLKQLTRQG